MEQPDPANKVTSSLLIKSIIALYLFICFGFFEKFLALGGPSFSDAELPKYLTQYLVR